MTEEGYIHRNGAYQGYVFQKNRVAHPDGRFPDGSNVLFWNTFYQDGTVQKGGCAGLDGCMENTNTARFRTR